MFATNRIQSILLCCKDCMYRPDTSTNVSRAFFDYNLRQLSYKYKHGNWALNLNFAHSYLLYYLHRFITSRLKPHRQHIFFISCSIKWKTKCFFVTRLWLKPNSMAEKRERHTMKAIN